MRAALRSATWLAASLVASFALFWSTLRASFLGDDFEVISDVVRDGPEPTWLTELGTGAHLRPILWTSVWANYRFGGMDPWGWHVVNVVLHGLTAWLVWLVARALLERVDQEALRRTVPPLAALIFLVSPVHAEPVSWVAARADLLMAPLCLVALLGWIRSRRVGDRWWLVTLAALALSLVAKESALTFVAVLIALDLWLPDPDRDRPSVRNAVRRAAPLLAIVGAYLVWYLALDGALLSDEGSVLRADGPVAIARRALQLVVRSVFPAMAWGWWLGAAAVAAVLMVLLVVGRERWGIAERLAPLRGLTGFAVTGLVLSIAPVARLGASPFTTAGERLAYLPSVFSALLVAVALGVALERWPRAAAVGTGAVLAFSVVALLVAQRTYVEGGRLASAVIASQQAFPNEQPVVVLAAPDTLDGAFVGRNAFGVALRFVNGRAESTTYHELSGVAMGNRLDTITVRPGSCTTCVVLWLDDPDASFTWTDPDAGLRIVQADDRRLEVDLGPPQERPSLWYVSGGRLVALGDH